MTYKGAVRRLRNKIIHRGEAIEALKPRSAANKAYVKGLEYALDAIYAEFPDVI